MPRFTDQVAKLDLSDEEIDAILQSIGASELAMSHAAAGDKSGLSFREYQAIRRAFDRVRTVLRRNEATADLHAFLDIVDASLNDLEVEGTVEVG